MTKQKNNYISNPWFGFIISLSSAIIFGIVAHLLSINWIPASALTFAIITQIFAVLRTKRLKTEFNLEKINILKRACGDKIGLARNLTNNQKDSPLIYCLIELEYLVTEIGKCCDEGDDKKKFQQVKGLLGSTKTTFDKSGVDPSIDKPYSDVMQCISELETYLNDI